MDISPESPEQSKSADPAGRASDGAGISASTALNGWIISGVALKPLWLAGAAMVIAASTTIALNQEPDFDRPGRAALLSVAWWSSPVETRPELQAARINRELHGFSVLPGTGVDGQDQIWVVGEAATILHSKDNGKSWSLVELDSSSLTTAPAKLNVELSTHLPAPDQPEVSRHYSDLSVTELFGTDSGYLSERSSEARIIQAAINEEFPRDFMEPIQKQQTGKESPNAPPNPSQYPESKPFPGSKVPIQQTVPGPDRENIKPDYSGPARPDLLAVHIRSSQVGLAVGRQGYVAILNNKGWRLNRIPRLSNMDLNVVGWDETGWIIGNGANNYGLSNLEPVSIIVDRGNNPILFAPPPAIRNENWHLDSQSGLLRVSGKAQRTVLESSSLTAPERRDFPVPPIVSMREQPGGPIYPAPWYYLSWLGALLLLRRGVVSAPPVSAAESSIENRAISDRPLEPEDPDVLDLGLVARSISYFLRNEATEPPLTIAVTGPWGSGKSSVLNLAEADLRQAGFRPVRFNAWHQQKEEELLASLLHAIRDSAIPPWYSGAGIIYRLNLLRIRFQRKPLPFYCFAALLVFAMFFLHDQSLKQILEALWAADWKKLFENSPLIAALIGAFGLANGLRSRLNSLGILGVSVRLLKGELNAKLGFRERFAREFRDVTQALKPTALVIMIDDLDRCQPDRVMETLEAINFLVTAGDCHIVLGMARDMVERAIAQQYEPMLAQVNVGRDEADNTLTETELKRRFARHYLEKLVNIEVPVPRMSPERAGSMLAPEIVEAPIPRNPWVGPMRHLFAAVLVVSLAASLGYLASSNRWDSMKEISDPDSMLTEKPPIPGTDSSTGPGSESPIFTGQNTGNVYAPKPYTTILLAPAEPGFKPLGWLSLILPGILFLAAAVATLRELLRRSRVTIIQNSPKYVSTIASWSEAIGSLHKSPRAVKRFLNKVRYLAMRQRVEPLGSAETPGQSRLGEEQIIVFSVLDDLRKRLGKEDMRLDAFTQDSSALLDNNKDYAAIRHSLQQNTVPHPTQLLNKYEALAAGVYIADDLPSDEK